jgi:aminoglycoside phosphotransferase (APT) family kinase protein
MCSMDQRARSWVEGAVGPGARVVRTRRLPGATSSDVRAVDVEVDGVDARRRLVLRRHTKLDWLEREPDLASREAVALELLAAAGVRTPELVAVDAEGWGCGEPAVLMTRLPGAHHWVPPSIERLAEVAHMIHSIDPPQGFRAYRRYSGFREPPSWATDPARWERALAIAEEADPMTAARGFIHRDHHPGNVLWARGRITAVVDWIEACVGPIAVDAARCRMNLWRHAGPEAAARYARCEGVVVDPLWDVVDSVDATADGMLPGPDAEALEAFLFAALDELG